MIICADDYGLREDIDEAVLDLCRLRRLSAVSCLAALERCNAQCLARLCRLDQIDVGLHLCLTHENLPLSPPAATHLGPLPFATLLRRDLFGRLRPEDVRREVAGQYELFVEKSGQKPSHIDGHLHVHQFPSVRLGLVDFVLGLPAAGRPYIRNTKLNLSELRRRGLPWRKAMLINWFGVRTQCALSRSGLLTNEGFSGIYDFREWPRYRDYFPKFAAGLRHPNGILVVHPGRLEDWRRAEYSALLGSPFASPPNQFQNRRSG